jgi:UPF0271 protein
MSPHAVSIDVNADLGEGCPNDVALLDRVTSASVSCGAHAGSPDAIRVTLEAAVARGVAVGAHPGYPDRANFGRVERSMSAQAVENLVLEQFGSLSTIAEAVGARLLFVKPHGALYNQAQREGSVASGLVAAARRLGLPLLGLAGASLESAAASAGVCFVREGFPERRYEDDGRLTSRTRSDAVLHDPAEIAAQVVRLVREGVATLCIHGDDPHALAKADQVLDVLASHEIEPRFWGRTGA